MMSSISTIIVAILGFFGLNLGVTATLNARKQDLGREPSNDTVSDHEINQRFVVRIPPSSTRPKPIFNPEVLAAVAEALAADKVANQPCENGGSVMVACTNETTADGLLGRLNHASLKTPLTASTDGKAIIGVDATREQTSVIRGVGHLIVKITPSQSKESKERVIAFYVGGDCTLLEIQVVKPKKGTRYYSPKVLVFFEDDRIRHVISEEADVCFAGSENARLSMVGGSADVFGGQVSGLRSTVTLLNNTMCVGGFDCRIHACHQSTVVPGTACRTTYYDQAHKSDMRLRVPA